MQAVTTIIKREKERVDRLERSYIFRQPRRLYDGYSQNLDQLTDQLIRTVDNQVKEEKYRVHMLDQELKAYHPGAQVKQAAADVDSLTKQLMTSARQFVKNETTDVNALIQSLDHLSPLKILSRGYAIAESGSGIVKSIDQVQSDEPIDITVPDGIIKARVEETVQKEME